MIRRGINTAVRKAHSGLELHLEAVEEPPGAKGRNSCRESSRACVRTPARGREASSWTPCTDELGLPQQLQSNGGPNVWAL